MAKTKKFESKYAALKQHAEEKLQQYVYSYIACKCKILIMNCHAHEHVIGSRTRDRANKEIARIRQTSAAEQARLEAQLRRVEAERDSALNTAQAKQKEVDELSRICDDLIARVDPTLPASPSK